MKKLAQAVFMQAISDAKAAALPAKHRKWKPNAIEWLTHRSADLDFWCLLMEIHPDNVIREAKLMLAKEG